MQRKDNIINLNLSNIDTESGMVRELGRCWLYSLENEKSGNLSKKESHVEYAFGPEYCNPADISPELELPVMF